MFYCDEESNLNYSNEQHILNALDKISFKLKDDRGFVSVQVKSILKIAECSKTTGEEGFYSEFSMPFSRVRYIQKKLYNIYDKKIKTLSVRSITIADENNEEFYFLYDSKSSDSQLLNNIKSNVIYKSLVGAFNESIILSHYA